MATRRTGGGGGGDDGATWIAALSLLGNVGQAFKGVAKDTEITELRGNVAALDRQLRGLQAQHAAQAATIRARDEEVARLKLELASAKAKSPSSAKPKP